MSRNGIDYVFCDARVRGLARVAADLAPDLAHVNGLVFPVLTWMLRRTLTAYFTYYHQWRTHLSLGKDTPQLRRRQLISVF